MLIAQSLVTGYPIIAIDSRRFDNTVHRRSGEKILVQTADNPALLRFTTLLLLPAAPD